MKPHVWMLGALALSQLACVGPYVPLRGYTRTEAYDLEHMRWLNAHCDLTEINESYLLGNVSGDQGNYAVYLGVSQADTAQLGRPADMHAMMVYACPEPTPWPREDGDMVRTYHKNGVKAGLPVLRCTNNDQEKASFEILSPGSGTAPTGEDYVRYRISPSVVIPPGRVKEAADWGLTAGKRRSWETANHIFCSQFRNALIQLKPGGKARVTALNEAALANTPSENRSMFEWEIELLEVGTVNLLYQQVGYRP